MYNFLLEGLNFFWNTLVLPYFLENCIKTIFRSFETQKIDLHAPKKKTDTFLKCQFD